MELSDKLILRNNTIQRLKSLINTKEKKLLEEKLLENLICTSYWNKANMIGLTISQIHEWDTKNIVERAWSEGKKVCVPKCLPKIKEMVFYEISSFDQLEVSYFNLLEPIPDVAKEVTKENIDLLIVPGLVFDKYGYRIGYGGGYYDRYLSEFNAPTLSLASVHQLIEKISREVHDIPVNGIITENGLILCEN